MTCIYITLKYEESVVLMVDGNVLIESMLSRQHLKIRVSSIALVVASIQQVVSFLENSSPGNVVFLHLNPNVLIRIVSFFLGQLGQEFNFLNSVRECSLKFFCYLFLSCAVFIPIAKRFAIHLEPFPVH